MVRPVNVVVSFSQILMQFGNVKPFRPWQSVHGETLTIVLVILLLLLLLLFPIGFSMCYFYTLGKHLLFHVV